MLDKISFYHNEKTTLKLCYDILKYRESLLKLKSKNNNDIININKKIFDKVKKKWKYFIKDDVELFKQSK